MCGTGGMGGSRSGTGGTAGSKSVSGGMVGNIYGNKFSTAGGSHCTRSTRFVAKTFTRSANTGEKQC